VSPQFAIIIERGADRGRTLVLPAEGTIAIGRDAEAGLPLGEPQASRHHAELTNRGGRVWLRDLGSANGTVFGEQRLRGMVELRPGDAFAIGDTVIRLVTAAPEAVLDVAVGGQETIAPPVTPLADDAAATAVQRGGVLNGRYRLDRLIGRGGFAQVFLATDLALQRQVAVKVLHAELTGDQAHDFLARFTREARAVAALDHPHILSIHDYGQAAGTVYLVMPYVRGGTLHDLLRRVSPADAGRYVRQVAAALDYAHRRQIVHRDIKPQNMLIRAEDQHLLLADFGIAKALTGTDAQSRTGVMGTLAYMAPEQFEGIVSPATDIYALGCVLFQLLTGEVPYSGSTEQVIFAHLQRPVPRLADRNVGGVPPAIQGVLDRALAKRQGDRYTTAGELAAAYDAALTGTGQPSAPVAVPPIVGHVASPPDPNATLLGPSGPAELTPPLAAHHAPPAGVPIGGYAPPAPASAVAPPTGGRRAFLAGVAGLGAAALLATAGGGALVLRSRSGAAAQAVLPTMASTAVPSPATVAQAGAQPATATVVVSTPSPPTATASPPTTTAIPPTATTLPTATTAPPTVAPPLPTTAAIVPSAVPPTPSASRTPTTAAVAPTAPPTVGPSSTPTPSATAVSGGFSGAAGRVLRGHGELVESVAFAPDGALLASGGDDNTARLWRSNGQGAATLTGHTADVNGVAWSPDGTFLATASGDGTLRTWLADGLLASTLKGHTDVVTGAAWLADSVALVSGSWDGTLRLWHAVRAENTRTIAAHNAKIWALALSAEKLVASGAEDTTIKLWGLDSTAKGTLRGHTSVVWGLSFSPDGAFLASCSKDGTVRLWDRSGNAIRTILSGLPPVSSAGLYDGRIIIVTPTGKIVATCTGHGGYITGLSWHPQGAILASGSQDATIRLWS
jgi:serine/threonine protein kinase